MTNALRALSRRLGIATLVVVVSVVMLYPIIWMIAASFEHADEIYHVPPRLVPLRPTLENFRIVWTQVGLLGHMFLNSVLVAGSITLIQIVLCSIAGYVFARLKFPGRNVLFAAVVGSLMVPAFLTVIPNYVILRDLGLLDTRKGLVLLSAFGAFGILLYRQFFLTLPRELDDAARVDGCNPLQSYLFVHLPLARSVIAVHAVLTFNAAWGDFFGPLIFIKTQDRMTLPLGISLIQGRYQQQGPGALVATLVLALLPVALVFLIARRHLVAAFATTGVK